MAESRARCAASPPPRFIGIWPRARRIQAVLGFSKYSALAAKVIRRASGRAVCGAFVEAMTRYGVPEEMLTDNGKQFTDRFGKSGEVLFDRICRDNGSIHRLTAPRHPTTTGKVERFHGSLRRELLNEKVPFADLAAAQAAVDKWVAGYNTTRPHQSLEMASPAERFSTAAAKSEQELLPLRLPAVLAVAAAPPGAALVPAVSAPGHGQL